MPALAAGALLLGCGDDADNASGERLSKPGYERAVKDVLKGIESPRPETPDTPEGLADTFAEARKRMLDLAAGLEQLRPPVEVERAQRDYIAGLRGGAQDIERLIEIARKGDLDQVKRILDRPTSFLSPQNAELISRARNEWAAKDYALGLEALPGAGR
jgi:hypothetical protein